MISVHPLSSNPRKMPSQNLKGALRLGCLYNLIVYKYVEQHKNYPPQILDFCYFPFLKYQGLFFPVHVMPCCKIKTIFLKIKHLHPYHTCTDDLIDAKTRKSLALLTISV